MLSDNDFLFISLIIFAIVTAFVWLFKQIAPFFEIFTPLVSVIGAVLPLLVVLGSSVLGLWVVSVAYKRLRGVFVASLKNFGLTALPSFRLRLPRSPRVQIQPPAQQHTKQPTGKPPSISTWTTTTNGTPHQHFKKPPQHSTKQLGNK